MSDTLDLYKTLSGMYQETLLQCPFCGSKQLRVDTMYFDDSGERDGVECMTCEAIAPVDIWNQRNGG